jgi:hypothetical protein
MHARTRGGEAHAVDGAEVGGEAGEVLHGGIPILPPLHFPHLDLLVSTPRHQLSIGVKVHCSWGVEGG